MLQPHLTSRVGRRLFVYFLLAALIPMGGLAWYAYAHVGTLLTEISGQRLRQDSKAYGMSLVEELTWRANELKRVADTLPAPTAGLPGMPPGFVALAVRPAPDLNQAQQPHFDHGQAVLNLSAAGGPELFVPLAAGAYALHGEIDRGGLWHNDSAPEQFCVLDNAFTPLFCTPGLAPPEPARLNSLLGNGNGGVTPWRIGDREYLLGIWRTRYLPAFASPGFAVMVALPKALANRDLERFHQIFPAIALLALALAVGLASAQIRRQMAPLDRLSEATGRLAKGELSSRVALTGDDEFADLGKAFNGMASNLEYKFHMLGLLSDLDRAILGATEMEYVVRQVLSHIRQAIPCDGAGLLTLQRGDGGNLMTCLAGARQTPVCRQIAVGADELPALTDEASVELTPEGDSPGFLRHLSDQPLARVFLFPIRVDDRLDGILLLAYRSRPEAVDDIVQAGRSLADRLAIASSSFAWEERLYHQAHYDALTDLPNRVLLRDRVEQAMMRADRNRTSAALMLIDLDNFKQINDSLGHGEGDRLLAEVARRLRQRARQGDTVARLGGDEFIVLIPDLDRGGEYTALDGMARAFNALLAQPIELDGKQVVIPASLGIALYPDNAGEYEGLLKMADAAMYESKRQQPGSFRFYSAEINVQTRARFELTQELREAVANRELVMYFQPKVTAGDGRIAGAEALVRWNSPTRGLVPPNVFVRLLDEMGLGTWLGEWVLDTVCAQLRAWDDAGLTAIPVSINLSPTQFERTPVPERVEATLDRYRLSPGRLELEILEATAVSDSAEVRASLEQLRALGVDIALDDFGTGYSSLVYLARIPANVLKLDRAFIRTLPTDTRQQEIVKLIVSLAKVLDFSVVAEGVEDTAQLALLQAMGCDYIQGYLIGRPIPADEFADRWLA